MENNKKSTASYYEAVDKRLLNVVEVKETTDISTVNLLLKENWIVIQVSNIDKGHLFYLGKVKSKTTS